MSNNLPLYFEVIATALLMSTMGASLDLSPLQSREIGRSPAWLAARWWFWPVGVLAARPWWLASVPVNPTLRNNS